MEDVDRRNSSIPSESECHPRESAESERRCECAKRVFTYWGFNLRNNTTSIFIKTDVNNSSNIGFNKNRCQYIPTKLILQKKNDVNN